MALSRAKRKMKSGSKKLAAWVRSQAKKNRGRRRNVEMGFWSGGVFHPIRASDDYDPEDVGERYQWKPAKKKSKKKKKNPRRREALVTGRGTGWIPAKAVRVRKARNGRVTVDVKR